MQEISSYLDINYRHEAGNIRISKSLFGTRCEIFGHSTIYTDNMSIILNTRKNIMHITVSKIDFLLSELEKILGDNGLMLNKDKTETLRIMTIQQLAHNGTEKLKLSTVN